MKNWTRLSALVLTLALALCFAGCGGETDKQQEEEAKTYSVTYVGGEGATGTAPEAKRYKEGETVTLAENPFTKEGYAFTAWSDGTKTYETSSAYTMPANDVTFTAQWEEVVPQLLGVWTCTMEVSVEVGGGKTANQTANQKIIFMEGDEEYDLYCLFVMTIGEDGKNGGIGFFEGMHRYPDEESVDAEESIYSIMSNGVNVLWSETDKTLRYIDPNSKEPSYYYTYSPLPTTTQYVEDGDYVWTEGFSPYGRATIEGEKATLYYADWYLEQTGGAETSAECELRHIGPYSVLMVAPTAPMPVGLIFFKTEDGFKMPPASGSEFAFFAKAAE